MSVVNPPRVLTAEEKDKLERDVNLVSDFQQKKLEREAKRNWDLFYKRNSTHFFKDRHWTQREFEELCNDATKDGDLEKQKTLLEVGCGVGNFFYPLLEEGSRFFVHACDLSPRAVQFVKEHPLYEAKKVHAFQCDVTEDLLTNHIDANSVDIVTLVFVLSSVCPSKMVPVLENLKGVLKLGGMLLFRDYGLYDHAMLRFDRGKKLEENFYVRQDGTRVYYFSKEKLVELGELTGYDVVCCEYVHRETVNKKENLRVPRVFVQAKFIKRQTNAKD
eukprot:m.63723 g.63723  ORF g.63723 m.63723 type:complete len:275 (+) comp35187_c0_seq1:74-898(+)